MATPLIRSAAVPSLIHRFGITMVQEKQLLDNLRQYQPQYYQLLKLLVWNRVPVLRRLAVFILLFLGKMGELRVILTKRSLKLRSFPGHVSLPGGKLDLALETEWQVARREMEEEIGLSLNNDYLLKNMGFTIEHLNILPAYLSRTFSAVRPCVGFMNIRNEADLYKLKISLNPGELLSIFLLPLRDFLHPISEDLYELIERTSHKVKWGGIPWNLRLYIFKQNNPNEAEWLREIDDLLHSEEEDEVLVDGMLKLQKLVDEWGRLGSRRDEDTNEKIYDVWGLTANILHDIAEVVYANRTHRELGEEELIYSLWKYGGQMHQKLRSEEEKKLINSRLLPNEFGFNDILPRTEFLKLKQIYKL